MSIIADTYFSRIRYDVVTIQPRRHYDSLLQATFLSWVTFLEESMLVQSNISADQDKTSHAETGTFELQLISYAGLPSRTRPYGMSSKPRLQTPLLIMFRILPQLFAVF